MKLIPNLAPIDAQAIQELEIPSLLLMEEAGRQVAVRVSRMIRQCKQKSPSVVIACGRGNNGGDGFVCARRLAMSGNCQITVIQTASASELSGDALINFNLLKHYPVRLVAGIQREPIQEAFAHSDLIVDALFGSGLSRPVEGDYRDIITWINRSTAPVVAVDLPSGVQSASGEVMGIAVKADYTVTFAAPKPGLFLYPGKGYAGKVETVDIGIPSVLIENDPSRLFLMTPELIRNLMPRREGMSHKYTYGSVLVVAGSREMPGAAAMLAEAALRAGAGLVVLASPASSLNQMQLPPEIIRLPLPETAEGNIASDAMGTLRKSWRQYTTVALGPGITTHPETVGFVEAFLAFLQHEFAGGVVLDADALNCLSMMAPAPMLSPRFILTPHLGECSRLIGLDREAIQQNLPGGAEQTADRYSAIVILKSASTLIFDSQSRQHWINPTGNPGMATAGSGDVLTGMIAGFLAQGLSSQDAARLSVYLHGLAGDLAAKQLTVYSLTATDLIRFLPMAMQQMSRG